MTIIMSRLDQLLPLWTKTDINIKQSADSLDPKGVLHIVNWRWLHTKWNNIRGSKNVSREEEEDEEDKHATEINQNEDEHFGNERWNLKDGYTFSIVYGNINNLPTYNNNKKLDA